MIIYLIVGFIKKILLCKMSYFLGTYNRIISKVKDQLDLSNYAKKSVLYVSIIVKPKITY